MATKTEQYRGIRPLELAKQPATTDECEIWEKLQISAQRVNQVALELEAAILEFKAIASQCKLAQHPQAKYQQDKSIGRPLNSQQTTSQKLSISSKLPNYTNPVIFAPVGVPWIIQKPNQSLLLTTRKIDLFRAERDAANLAESLRSQNRRKLNQKPYTNSKNVCNAFRI